MNLKSKKGFTLVELIIVIAILGVIAMIAVPALAGVMSSSRVKADYNSAAKIAETVRIWLTDATPTEVDARKTATADWVDVNSVGNDLNKLLGSEVHPQGLADSAYYILVDPTTEKVVIAIAKEEPTGDVLTTPYNFDKTTPNTITAGIVYIDGIKISQDSTVSASLWNS